MGRTAGGAGILASASATRLDGPLDNFIEQVFKPFLYILDYLVLHHISDAEIKSIIGEELGQEFILDMQEFHDSKHEYEVLAGASLAAKRIMAQSMTLITQIFSQPNIQKNLAEINEEYIDFKPILEMWMESSEWKNKQDIIKKMTPAMKQKQAAASQLALQQRRQQLASRQNNKSSRISKHWMTKLPIIVSNETSLGNPLEILQWAKLKPGSLVLADYKAPVKRLL